MTDPVQYTVDRSGTEDIENHLARCDASFVPPLSGRVRLASYAAKLRERATTMEAWSGERLVGLVAAYLSIEDRSCFISNVSVDPGFARQGVATALLRTLLQRAEGQGMTEVRLEVSAKSAAALRIYESLGFEPTGRQGDVVLMARPTCASLGGSDRAQS